MTRGMDTYETEMPWIVYHYGRTHDRWWPPLTSSRVLGYAIVECECAVCGVVEAQKMSIPRFGVVPEPEGGRHPKRLRFMYDHLHADRQHPMTWAKPLLNPAAHPGGIDLKLLAARLERDLGIEVQTR